MAKYSYEDFLEIVKTLRSENGCPWDKVQTHESLRPCMTEEAAEVLAAIRIYGQTGDYDNLREELGDVLLQVVMHARIAEEEGLFTMEEVVSEIAEKMVRRHPHVFGNEAVEGSDQVLQNWEEIKKKEKEGKREEKYPLHEIPIELPSLTRGIKVFKKTDKLYGDHMEYDEVVANLQERVTFLKNITPENYSEDMSKELGKMMMDLCRISAKYKLSLDQILSDEIYEYIDRFESL